MSVRSIDRRSSTLASFVCVVVLLAMLPRRGHAQQVSKLPPDGSYVRVLVSEGQKVGTLLWSRSDTLSLGYCCGVSPDTIPLDSILAMDVHEGTWGLANHIVGGMTIGLVGGAGLTYGVGKLVCRKQPDPGLCDDNTAIYAVLAGITGFFVGGVVGAIVDNKKQWQPVRLRLSVAPDPRSGLRLGLAIPLR